MENAETSVPTGETTGRSDRTPWIRPELTKLRADAAEQGGATSTDLGVNFS